MLQGLLATRRLKEILIAAWGPYAVGLGTVPVERMWWQYYLQAVNRSGGWATYAWRQYHAVQSWRKDVVRQMRKLLCTIGFRGANADIWQTMRVLMHSLQHMERPLMLFEYGDSRPRVVADDDDNIGFKGMDI